MYERLNERYKKGYCTIEQLRRFKDLGVITEEEFLSIVGKDGELCQSN